MICENVKIIFQSELTPGGQSKVNSVYRQAGGAGQFFCFRAFALAQQSLYIFL